MRHRLKIMVLSGLRLDQGKTSIVDNLVAPRLENLIRFEIDSGSTGSSKAGVKRIAAIQLSDVRKSLMDMSEDESLVCDVGGSQGSNFMDWVSQHKSMVKEFDRIIFVLKVGGLKQGDAIESLIALFQMGAEPNKVTVIFNMAPYCIGHDELRRNLMTAFPDIFAQGKAHGFHVCTTPIVQADALYKTVFNSPDWTVDDLADAPDFRAEIRSLKKEGKEIPTALFVLEAAQENARSFGKANLDAVWAEVMDANSAVSVEKA